MKRILLAVFIFSVLLATAAAQRNVGSVKVSPNGVNVNANGATSVFVTFGGLNNQVPAEACWCGELISAAPAIGSKCNPATIFGCLPARYDQSTLSGNHGFTDIMSIPVSVSRRAYQAAQDGVQSDFFYVRRFVSTKGGPDEYVSVSCRMASGGVSVPLALTDVSLNFDVDKPVLFVKSGEPLPPIRAEIAYNGTGRLVGRWEIVKPGDELPSARDLLTEGSLPVEERGAQRRYTQVSRFNVFLPPTGKYTLAGPDPSLLPSAVEGGYLVLLRVEVTDDKDGGANLGAAGAGKGFVTSGALAGFPMPVLRYFVGSSTRATAAKATTRSLGLLLPADNAEIEASRAVEFSWNADEQAALYRIEIEDPQGAPVLSALLQRGFEIYRAPSWLRDKTADGNLRWRVVALDGSGNRIGETQWHRLRIARAN